MDGTNTAYAVGQIVGGVVGCAAMITLPVLLVVSLALAVIKKSKGWGVVAGLSGVALFGFAVIVGVVGFLQARKQGPETAGAPQVAVADVTTAGTTVASSEGRALLDIPDDWQALDLENDDASLQVGNPAREEYLLVIAEPTTDFDLDLDGFTELASGLTLGAFHDAEAVGPARPIELNGLPARRLEIRASNEGLRIVYHATYVEGAGHYYQVLAWTLPSKRDAAFPRFDTVVATFRER